MLNFRTLVAASALVLLAACGGGGGKAGTSAFTTVTGTGTSTGTTSVATSSQGSVVLSLSSTQISSSSPGTVTAVVRNASGSPVAGALVSFAISGGATTIATISPDSAVTNSAGEAATTIRPVSSSASGGAFLIAVGEIPGITTTFSTKVSFSVSALNVTLNSVNATKTSLTAYDSTSVNFTVAGASASNPVKISVASTCSQSGKATISPASLTLTSTSGSVTYKDQGCASPDQVNVAIEGTSQQQSVALTIAAPVSTALQFVTASPSVIGLKGSGSPTSSLVTFKLTDSTGAGKAGEVVNFTLDQPNIANLTTTSGTTGSDGTVAVNVSAKSTPSPVRVKATLASNTTIFVPSNELTINAGRPHQNGFSIAFAKSAMNGNLDGDESEIRLTLADRYSNPVPDGTRANLVAEGGVVIPASCTTVNSVCTVKFVVSEPRPLDGRVSITAYAVGEESYTDNDGNLDYTSGEPFGDLGQVFIDKNDNSSVDSGEYITGTTVNGTWDDNTYVRKTGRVFFSVTASAPRLFAYDAGTGTCTNTPLSSPAASINLALTQACSQSFVVCLRDANTNADSAGGNPISSGSTVTATTPANAGASVEVDNSPTAAIVLGPTRHVITVKRSTCITALTSDDAVNLKVKMGASSNEFTLPNVLQLLK